MFHVIIVMVFLCLSTISYVWLTSIADSCFERQAGLFLLTFIGVFKIIRDISVLMILVQLCGFIQLTSLQTKSAQGMMDYCLFSSLTRNYFFDTASRAHGKLTAANLLATTIVHHPLRAYSLQFALLERQP